MMKMGTVLSTLVGVKSPFLYVSLAHLRVGKTRISITKIVILYSMVNEDNRRKGIVGIWLECFQALPGVPFHPSGLKFLTGDFSSFALKAEPWNKSSWTSVFFQTDLWRNLTCLKWQCRFKYIAGHVCVFIIYANTLWHEVVKIVCWLPEYTFNYVFLRNCDSQSKLNLNLKEHQRSYFKIINI